MRLLHVSDPHFGTEQAPVVAALQRLARELVPDVLVLSGDITQRARRAQFEAARRFVDALGVATRVVIPGNHDIPLFDLWTRLTDPYRGFRRAFGDELEPALMRDDLLLLAVRTTRRERHKHGEIDADQVARVAARLRTATSQQLRVVVVHQPMHVPRPQDEENLLRGAEAAARAWSAAGADLVLGGHIHLPYVLPMSQRYTGLGRELWCVQAGTAVSSRVRWEAPNSVNLIEFEQGSGRCDVTRWDYAAADARFAAADAQAIALQREGVGA
jgi:3',5'-cyclic AMP phosphodiesterase CpdA